MFSDRLWQDKERLGRNLRVGLTQSMILGEGIPQITDRINKGIDTARYNAERVARTETKRVTYCAHDDVYKDTGVEELRYRCANGGDSRTCQYCRADNGKVFKRGEEPTLPRHPNCRCVYIPVVSDTFEDNELNELTGSVRGAENYEKWREAEAKKQEEVKIVEKVNTKTVEKELKENPTPVPEQIKLTDYPQVFYATKPEAKNTQALLDYMNSKTSVDPNVVALYTKMDKLCDGLSDVNTNTATQTQEQGNGTQTNTTANANTTGAGADSTPKVKTEEEIRAELQKEYEKMADKRVTDAIKKKEKEWADKQAKEKMTEDERRQAEEQERLQAQAKRDLDLTIKGLKLDVVDAVQEMGLDAGFRNLIAVEDLATITDEDERKAKLTERVKGMKKLFDAEVAKEVAKAKAEFLKGSTPATGSSSNKKDETKYDAYKKAGNVKGMLNEKLGAYRNKENEE